MTITKYKAAAVNSEPEWFDLQAGVQKTIAFIKEAGDKGCKLIGFPEVWLPGYPGWLWIYSYGQNLPLMQKYRENSLAVDSEEFRRIRRAARDNSIFVSLGFAEIDHGTIFMSQALIDPHGNVINHRRKIKPTHYEKVLFGDGSGDTFMPVTETELGRVGHLACWEHGNPFLKALAVSQGEQIHVAAWPVYSNSQVLPMSDLTWGSDVATLEYAIETGSWVIAPFQRLTAEGVKKNTPPGLTPDPDTPTIGGYARIYKPGGALAVPNPTEDFDGLLIAEIDLDAIHLVKSHADWGGHYMRPDLIRLLVDTGRKELITEIDPTGGIKFHTTAQRLGLDRPLDTPREKTSNGVSSVRGGQKSSSQDL
ncbi:carbon-nitrogen hydrolase [Trichoderma sp. SZMC 28012]